MTNALDQYLELYDAQRDALLALAPAVMDGPRRRARIILDGARAGAPGNEGHPILDLDAMLAPDLGLNLRPRDPDTAPAKIAIDCAMPAVAATTMIVDGDNPAGIPATEPGVTVTTFARATAAMQQVIERHYSNIAADAGDSTMALDTLLAHDGLLVHVAAGTHAARPLQIIQLLRSMLTPDGAVHPVLAVRRMLVVLDPGSSLDLLLCDHERGNGAGSVSLRTLEVALGRDASLGLYDLEETAGDTGRVAHTAVRLDAGARLRWFGGTLRGGRTRNTLDIHLDGPGADAQVGALAIVDGTQRVETIATVHHHSPHATCNQRFKYIVGGEGRGAFEGLIRVDHGAHHTDASQNCRTVLTSPTARMHTAPQLEIYCDDVKCGHGAATGQLDERALFYMRSRGIPLDEARAMLLNAFMADVLDTIALEPLAARMRHLIERRLAGESRYCNGCPGAANTPQP